MEKIPITQWKRSTPLHEGQTSSSISRDTIVHIIMAYSIELGVNIRHADFGGIFPMAGLERNIVLTTMVFSMPSPGSRCADPGRFVTCVLLPIIARVGLVSVRQL